MTAGAPRKKLIEVSIPLEAINTEASRRKQKAPKGYPTAIHKYWAQRPIAACRAVLFAQLVDDPSSWPDRFPTEEAVEAERRRLHRVIERMVPWEASNDEAILSETRWEIARSVAWGHCEEPPAKGDPKAILAYLQEKAPPVYDPFSGGGSIPLEAQRLGLRAYGSDLNPVAVLIGRALVEIPPKFAGRPPVNPKSRKELERGRWNGRGAQGLAEDVRFYGQWMRDEAEKRIGHLYPKVKSQDGSEATVIAWLWARTVRSPDPAVKGAMVPLVSSFVLSKKEGRKAWVEPVIDPAAPDGWRFEVRMGELTKADESRLKNGTKTGRGSFVCILTGTPIPEDWSRAEGKAKRLGMRLMAIVAEGGRQRVYLPPTTEQEVVANTAKPNSEPEGELFDKALGFRVPAYGLRRWADLFTPRQLVALTTFSDLVGTAREQVMADAVASGLAPNPTSLHEGGAGATAYADAVATYLGLVVDRMVFYGSSLCGWLPKDNAMGKSMPQQTLSMSWDFAEGNPLGKSSSDILTCAKSVADCLDEARSSVSASILQADAASLVLDDRYLISTDPPYYDNVGYADLSDFFFVWLRRPLLRIWPDLFRRLATPKAEELVATPHRHGGGDAAEAFFMDGMGHALTAMRKAATNAAPLTIFYAFKQSEVAADGITSAGWASFLQAVVGSGLTLDGTWPIRTENASRMRGQGSNALASSIVLVCRKRSKDAPVVTRADFIRALRHELPEAIDDIRKAGVGPVDMQQSVIGPGMGVFSRNAKVLEDDDSAMTVRTALALINRVWEEIDQALDAAFEPETQVALAWYATYGFDARPSGELIVLAQAKNTALDALFATGVFQNLHGRAALTGRDRLPADWTPAADKTLTVWECVQHTARVLNAPEGGAEAAGRLVAQMGATGDQARALAYRLFEIATQKGWAPEALVYNALAQEWSHLEDAGARVALAAPAQAALDL